MVKELIIDEYFDGYKSKEQIGRASCRERV